MIEENWRKRAWETEGEVEGETGNRNDYGSDVTRKGEGEQPRVRQSDECDSWKSL